MASALAGFVDGIMDRYPSGYVEVLASVSVQLIYLAFGLFVECIRPAYVSETSRKMLVQSLRNHVAATLVHVLYVAWMGGQPVLTRTFATRPYTLPPWTEVVRHLAIALVLRDVLFYTIHQLWHLPQLYKFVHAKHHEVRRPSRHHILTISYMSVTDFMFLYGFPVMAVAKALEMDILTTMAFSFVSAVGEQIRLVFGDVGHDEHHLTNTGDYGVYGIMDTLFSRYGHGAAKKRKMESQSHGQAVPAT
ncbi:fatty acid hydroxylase superfamily protein [Niveomyces insectorum RCEF 264]|uniref:Fatty acid hydroxylase superfamily protein n=1 Tax=Niveomyces insectorum RCEF 264 TaxID=1081102 RepID=A0A167QRK8_9HYPO|nr:fatty acid hydroxylase superfamily protein [Niveomyces insectorum RCEF 264]